MNQEPLSTTTTDEIWKDIPDYGGDYSVSSLGRVRINVTRLPRKKGDIIKTRIHSSSKRLRILLSKKGKGQIDHMLDKLVAEAFVPNTLGTRVINHIDGNPLNCEAANLCWGTIRKEVSTEPLIDDDGSEWRDILDSVFSGIYQVSNKGQVKRVAGTQGTRVGRLLSPILSNGNLLVNLSVNGFQDIFLLHRLVARVFHGIPEAGAKIHFKDECRTNCAADNLEWRKPTDEERKDKSLAAIVRHLPVGGLDDVVKKFNEGWTQSDIGMYYEIAQPYVSLLILAVKSGELHSSVSVIADNKEPREVEYPKGWQPCPRFPGLFANRKGAIAYQKEDGTMFNIPQNDVGHGYRGISRPYHLGVPGTLKVHRLVADAFIGDAEGRDVDHINSIRDDNVPSNLRYVSKLGNNRARFGYKIQ